MYIYIYIYIRAHSVLFRLSQHRVVCGSWRLLAAMDFRSAPAPPSLRQIAFNIRVEAEHAKHAETVSHSVWQAVFRADMMAREHMLEAKRRSEWMELLATGAEAAAAAAADLTAARAAASSDSRFDHSRSPPRTPKKKM